MSKKIMSRSSLLLTGVGILSLSTSTVAQSASKEMPSDSQDIVVTANKRPERLRDVAGSISVLTGQQLVDQHLNGLADYARNLPGVNISSSGSPARTTIVFRGIASTVSGALVGTYVDDTPVGSSTGWNFASTTQLDLPPFELQQLEVLRGPQGTLYGASTMGGLLKYVLTPASTRRFAFQAGADLAAVDGARGLQASGRVAINLPIVPDVLGLRLSAFENHTPGYIDDVVRGRTNVNSGDSYGGRVALQFTPADTLSAKFNAMWFRAKYNDGNVVSFDNPTIEDRADNSYIIAGYGKTDGLTQGHYFPLISKKRLDYYSLTVDWKPGAVNVTSATSWSHGKTLITQDETLSYGPLIPVLSGGAVASGFVNFPETNPLDKFTQELRISSPDGQHPFEWMIGGFYTHEKAALVETALAYDAAYRPIPAFSPYMGLAFVPTTYREEAVFGNATWHITDKFDVAGGIRYSHNKQSFSEQLSGPLFGALIIPGGSSESIATWMANARYHFSKDIMAYVRVATGYRPGGPNTQLPNVPTSYRSDRLTNYEGGLKASFADHKGSIDLSGFYIDWKHIQLFLIQNGLGYFANAGTARSSGVEFSASYRLWRGLTIGGNAAYTRAKVVKAEPGTFVIPGYQLPNIPKVSLTGFAAYDWRLSDRLNAHVGGNVHWVGGAWSSAVQERSLYTAAAARLPAYATVDLDANIADGRFTYKLFVRNVTNKHAFQGAVVSTDAGLTPVKLDYAINQPRTIGFGVDVAF